MYFKVRINCELCGCDFALCPFQFKDRAEFACPNCGQRLGDDVSAHLRAGLSEFALIPNRMKDGGKFSLSVDASGDDSWKRQLQENKRLNPSTPG